MLCGLVADNVVSSPYLRSCFYEMVMVRQGAIESHTKVDWLGFAFQCLSIKPDIYLPTGSAGIVQVEHTRHRFGNTGLKAPFLAVV